MSHIRIYIIRELNPEVLLLDSKKIKANVKIIDFGTAQVFDKNHNGKAYANITYYSAPEVINKKYDNKCDLWSAGVILYVLLSGSLPFNGSNPAEIARNILKGKFSFAGGNWTNISKEAKDLVLKMLVLNPAERISAVDAVKHPWIASTLAQDENLLGNQLATNSLQILKKFSVVMKLKQNTMQLIIRQFLSEKEKTYQQELFRAIDTNCDVQIGKQELLDGCVKVFGKQMNKEQIDAIFLKVDIDNSGAIDYNEFLLATISEEKIFSESNLLEMFEFLNRVIM